MSSADLNYIIVAGGCFWGMEDLFASQNGVVSTEVGYTGGDFKNPTYKDITTGTTGHAESIKISFDNSKTNLKDILRFFFKIHDPTTPNRQGNDVGSQYRSAIFFKDGEHKAIIEEVIAETNELGRFKNPVTTSLEKEMLFYSAEEYHQNYLKKNPGGYTCHFIRD